MAGIAFFFWIIIQGLTAFSVVCFCSLAVISASVGFFAISFVAAVFIFSACVFACVYPCFNAAISIAFGSFAIISIAFAFSILSCWISSFSPLISSTKGLIAFRMIAFISAMFTILDVLDAGVLAGIDLLDLIELAKIHILVCDMSSLAILDHQPSFHPPIPRVGPSQNLSRPGESLFAP